MSSGHGPADHHADDQVAPWDSEAVGTIVGWAAVVAIVALVFPLLLNVWSRQILQSIVTRGTG